MAGGSRVRARADNPVRCVLMVLDPRTPVIAGVGQVTNLPDPDVELIDRPDPSALMARSLRLAAEDCGGSNPGGAASVGDRLLRRASSLRVVAPLGWRTKNPALSVAQILGIEPREFVLSGVGGNNPESILHASALSISRGEMDVVAVTGAECMYTHSAALRQPGGRSLNWPTQPAESTPEPVEFGTDRPPVTNFELERGIMLPIHAYPLLENALRGANGWSVEEHRARIGRLWSSFSKVAASNPYAWIREFKSPEEIVEATASNRMVTFPYTKLCTANLQVDQGAGYIVCSLEAALSAGVPKERLIFPLAGADAHDHWFLSHRMELHRSPAIHLAGRAALEMAGVGIDDVGLIDLYSCFPCAVQIAAHELGLRIDDPARPLTLTGGLTFGGGPGNNYTSHAIASVVTKLREEPGSVGLVTGLGWYATKHSIGVFASRPPAHDGVDGFRWRDVQDEVDSLPQRSVDSSAVGAVVIETYAVTYDREGAPERAIVACVFDDGRRTWANITDPDSLESITTSEGCGRTGTLQENGVLDLT
ncbi:MAG: acetyl-CoA acetyltransferase [Actinobacteria bacterium]|nr:acetyl-CoA acetyltransferase [Actinomycetota bacterium]